MQYRKYVGTWLNGKRHGVKIFIYFIHSSNHYNNKNKRMENYFITEKGIHIIMVIG